MDDFIETGSGGGIGFGLCDDITHAVIDEERMTSLRKYHTITEAKNGAGATPSRQTEVGYISHMEFVIPQPVYVTSFMLCHGLKRPGKSDRRKPSGLLIGPRGEERVGDVSNVVFTNGAIANGKGKSLSTMHPAILACMWQRLL